MGLEGKWTNELGSTFVVDSVSNGTISGTYETAVSAGACAKGTFTVTGRTDVDSRGTSIAWSVVWKNDESSCNSVTAWTGQYVPQADEIIAFWLLSSHSDELGSWGSTNLGVDSFWRSGARAAAAPGSRPPLGRSHP